MTLQGLRSVLNSVSYAGADFLAYQVNGGFLFQIVKDEACTDTGEIKAQYGREWFVSNEATEADVVRTALLAALTWAEHEAREAFKYKGKRLFSPHFEFGEGL